MAGWHHWLDGHESVWTPGVADGQGGLADCNSWGRKESDTIEQLNWTETGLNSTQLRILDWALWCWESSRKILLFRGERDGGGILTHRKNAKTPHIFLSSLHCLVTQFPSKLEEEGMGVEEKQYWKLTGAKILKEGNFSSPSGELQFQQDGTHT